MQDIDIKNLFGSLAVILSFAGYAPYLRDLYLKRIQPHIFSWFLWGLMASICATAQILDGAGAGSWTLVTGVVVCLIIVVSSLKRGTSNITKSDWITFIAALMAIPVWLLTNSPLWTIIIVTAIDFLAFIPTFRKSYHEPYGETLITYVINSLKFVLSFLALSHISFVTAFYISYLIIVNASFATMLVWRRRAYAKQSAS